MMDELIAKIAAQTGLPASTVAPVIGALLAHLGDVLPAPIAHHIAIALGVHQDDGGTDPQAPAAAAPDAAGAQAGAGGLFGALAGSLLGGGAAAAPGGYPGAASLMNAAQSLLAGYLNQKR